MRKCKNETEEGPKISTNKEKTEKTRTNNKKKLN